MEIKVNDEVFDLDKMTDEELVSLNRKLYVVESVESIHRMKSEAQYYDNLNAAISHISEYNKMYNISGTAMAVMMKIYTEYLESQKEKTNESLG